jgi:heat-inducible transcriptional repressor
VVPLSSSRIMFVINVRGGLLKTIVLEVESGMDREELDRVVPLLNERLAGLTLDEIRRSFAPRIRDIEDQSTGIIRLVINEGSVLFSEQSRGGRLRVGGAQNMLLQPEFQGPAELRNLIELIEDEHFVVQLLENQTNVEPGEGIGRAAVAIGSENTREKAEKYSVVSARYRLGDTIGTVGVIGPTRMDYSRVVALVENMAALLSSAPEDLD